MRTFRAAFLLICAASAMNIALAGPINYIFGFSPSGTQTLTLNGSIVLNATNTGWYDNSGAHSASNVNYEAGPNESVGNPDHHDFFVFNLAGVTAGITSATLSIGNASNGYMSDSPFLTYSMFDVSTPIGTLIATQSGRTDIFADLGSGTVYASRTVSAADDGTQVLITLDAAAIAAINASIGSQFAIGGAVVITPEPAAITLVSMGIAGLVLLRRRRS
jgi:hypothetical protein